MQLIRIRTDDELMWYKEIWDAILEEEDNDNPFIEFAWFYNWWQIVGRKERVELYAIEHEGTIMAFFPFTVSIRWGIRVYAFAGENIANYTGIVTKKEWLQQVTTFVFDELIKKHRHIIFSLHGLLESKQSTKTLEQYFVERQLRTSIFRVVTPYLAFSEIDFQHHFNQRRKMHGVDRRERKLRNLGSLARRVPSQDELWQMFRLFDRRWAKKLDTSGFTKGRKRDFFERLTMLKGEALQVEVDALVFENQWIAFTYGLCCRGRYVTYALAHEPTFNLFGAGRIVNQKTIQRTFAANYRLFDMSIGYEPYKFDWRSDIDFTRQMLASSGTKRTNLLAGFLSLKQRLKEYVKGNQRVVEWKRNTLGHLRYLVKYGKVKDWLEYGQQFVEKIIRLKQVELYELSPSEDISPQQPVGNLFEEMSIQEAMQLDQEEVMALFYKGYTIYKDSFAETNKPAFALHATNWRVDSMQIVEALPKQTYFLAYDVFKQIDIITAFFRKINPSQTLWVTVSFWQWRKRKRLVQLGYKPISRMKHYKIARFERHRVEKYTESGAMYILSIKSKRWNIAMHHFYFLEKPANVRKSMKVVGYTHSLVPSRKLVKSETIHIDLQEHELSLYLALSEGNRKILRRAQKESYQVILYKEPSIENLRAFQQFYNQFAKRKKIEAIGKSQMETILLLNEQGALLLSEIQSVCGQTLCYRLDIVHEKKAMSFYEATCHASAMPAPLKRPIRYANRFLIWHNLLHLKEHGFVLYDMGELTDNRNVRAFKLSFGGQVVHVYSGYIIQSKIRALLLGVQKWRK